MSAVLAAVKQSPIPAPNILLMGAGGTGKTFSIRTLVDQGIHPFVLSLDPGGLPTIGDVPADKLSWHVISPGKSSWTDLIKKTNERAALTMEGISSEKDYTKANQKRFVNVLEALANFKDDRTGQSFGAVDDWGTNRAIVLDHLTELGQASKEWTVGSKLVLHQGEWQVAQNNAMALLRNLVTVCRCWVIVLAHIDRETDQILQSTRIMVHALGRAMAPQLPPLFSDVILSAREGIEFRWSTAEPNTDLKTQNLSIHAKLPPSFSSIVEKWKSRGGIIES